MIARILTPILFITVLLLQYERTHAGCNDTTEYKLGTIKELSDTCGNGQLLPNTYCKLLEVQCPALKPMQVELRITPPDAGVAERGTVVFSSGGNGVGFYGSAVGPLTLFKELTAMGFRIIDRSWLGTQGWTSSEGGMRRESCRYATLLLWIYNNIYKKGAFVISGNSGGSAEIGYALTSWGMDNIVNLAVPTSGPAVARLDYACPGTPTDEWKSISDTIIPAGAMTCTPGISLSPTDGVCRQCGGTPTVQDWIYDGVVHPGGLMNYPKTKVHFIFGADDCDGPPVPIGLTWAKYITSECEIEFAANTPHLIPGTPEGREAIRKAIDLGTQSKSAVESGKESNSGLKTFRLEQNRPNPFMNYTVINFYLPKEAFVILKVIDELGRETATILNCKMTAGSHSVTFNSNELHPGIYFYCLRAGSLQDTKIMFLINDK
ncbi:MAG: T9SS type A sorting domain-containing protein [FCB group bacterium]|jgi:hypothetical protein